MEVLLICPQLSEERINAFRILRESYTQYRILRLSYQSNRMKIFSDIQSPQIYLHKVFLS